MASGRGRSLDRGENQVWQNCLASGSHLCHLSVAQWLLAEGGASIAETNCFGQTALLLAARPVDRAVAIGRGWGCDHGDIHQGRICLASGSQSRHLSVVQWLLAEGGAAITETSIRGESALLTAASAGQLSVVQGLLGERGPQSRRLTTMVNLRCC